MRQLLFNVIDDDDSDFLEEMGPVHSWDVMDQFPPYNGHDWDGGLIYHRLCAEAVSPPQEVHPTTSPSTAPKYVFMLFSARCSRNF